MHMERLLRSTSLNYSTEPLSPAVVQARKEADAKAMEWMELALQQLREKQTA